MSEFETIPGFEEIWRRLDPFNRRKPEALLGRFGSGGSRWERLARVAAGARETVVIFTGATYDRRGLQGHLNYISRGGTLALEDQDGIALQGKAAMAELAEDWSAMSEIYSRLRDDMPLSRSITYSMPPGTDREAFSKAVRVSAHRQLGGRFEFAWLRHDDTPHPHAHLVVRAMGEGGLRFTPRRSDADLFREDFATDLRDQGVFAEATRRSVRGVTRRGERHALYRMRRLYEAGAGPIPRTLKSAYLEASDAAFDPSDPLRPWELQIIQTQARLRGLYARQADLLASSPDEDDRRLATNLHTFVAAMPPPDTRRQEMARQLFALADLLKARAVQNRVRIR